MRRWFSWYPSTGVSPEQSPTRLDFTHRLKHACSCVEACWAKAFANASLGSQIKLVAIGTEQGGLWMRLRSVEHVSDGLALVGGRWEACAVSPPRERV